MKVLFDCPVPFMLIHGGAQTQIEQTMAALEKLGVSVEPLRWWDENQSGDILHHFCRMSSPLLCAAQQKGMKVVVAELLTGQGSRSPARIKLEKLLRRLLLLALPGRVAMFSWSCYRLTRLLCFR